MICRPDHPRCPAGPQSKLELSRIKTHYLNFFMTETQITYPCGKSAAVTAIEQRNRLHNLEILNLNLTQTKYREI